MKLRKEFSSEVDSTIAALRGIKVDSSSGHADLTQLFRVANHEAKKSRAQSRILRVVRNAGLTFYVLAYYFLHWNLLHLKMGELLHIYIDFSYIWWKLLGDPTYLYGDLFWYWLLVSPTPNPCECFSAASYFKLLTSLYNHFLFIQISFDLY